MQADAIDKLRSLGHFFLIGRQRRMNFTKEHRVDFELRRIVSYRLFFP